jgi:hypothetical protein
MGREPIGTNDAILRLARPVALKILRNEVSPYDGGCQISDLSQRGDYDRLPIILKDNSLEVSCIDQGEPPEKHEPAIVALVRSLVEEQPR